jgi:histidinol-phosphate aminotransferase
MKNPYFRDNVNEMSAYVPGEQPPSGAKVVKLNTNENPYPPSPHAVEAARLAADNSLRLYPDPAARELREAAGKAWGFDADWIIATNGSDELLAMLVRACVPEGGSVAYPVPTYSLYPTLVEAHGAEAVEVPWAEGHAIPEGLAGSGARLVFLGRPNAPTGTCVPLDEVRALAGDLDGVLCVDEAYADFADDDALDIARNADNVIVARTLSKSYSLAGMRIGLGVANPGLLEGLWKTKDSYNLDRVAIAAGTAALLDGEWMKRNAAKIRATRQRLTEELNALGFECVPSQANFVLVRVGSPRAGELYEALKAHGILVRYFDREGLRDCLRITVGTEMEVTSLLGKLRDMLRESTRD